MAKFDIQEDVQTYFFRDQDDGFKTDGDRIVINTPVTFKNSQGAVQVVLNNLTYHVREDAMGIRRLAMTGDVDKKFNGIGRLIFSLQMSESVTPIPFIDRAFHQIPNLEGGSFEDTDRLLKLIGNPAKYAQRLFFTGRLNRFSQEPEGKMAELVPAAG